MKHIITPSGRSFKFGRKPRPALGPRLSLRRYLMPLGLPPVPSGCDYTKAAMPSLTDIYCNDTLGCCVISGTAHTQGVATGNAGDLFLWTRQQVIDWYAAIGGYVPGDDSTDNGCDEVTALNFLTETGYPNGTKATGWLAVDPSNQQEVKTAMWLFENLFFGVCLPDGWVNPMPESDGFVWDVVGGPDVDNGHCFVGCGFNSVGVQIDSWGMLGTVTWAALQQYCSASSGGALYTVLTPDQVNKATAAAPNGIDWATLQHDFDIIKG